MRRRDVVDRAGQRRTLGAVQQLGVPTRDELVGIVDKSVTGCGSGSPCIDPIFGPTKAFRYWASNPAQRTSRGSVDFFAGGPQIDFQLNQFHARAVRLGP